MDDWVEGVDVGDGLAGVAMCFEITPDSLARPGPSFATAGPALTVHVNSLLTLAKSKATL